MRTASIPNASVFSPVKKGRVTHDELTARTRSKSPSKTGAKKRLSKASTKLATNSRKTKPTKGGLSLNQKKALRMQLIIEAATRAKLRREETAKVEVPVPAPAAPTHFTHFSSISFFRK